MALPPEVEARIHACETAAQDLFDEFEKLESNLDKLSSDVAIVLPNGTWDDDPSVVRHVEALQTVAERVRRESVDPLPMSTGAARARTGG
jgi:hypothetical protein